MDSGPAVRYGVRKILQLALLRGERPVIRKLLIALFGVAICLAAIFAMNPPAASSGDDKKPPAKKGPTYVDQYGKSAGECAGCIIPVN
jgi:hypothetical protein